jgi:hypothetical protein
VEKGFEKIILQFTTDFENALLFKQGVFILQILAEKRAKLLL